MRKIQITIMNQNHKRMKKLFLSIAFILGAIVAINAQTETEKNIENAVQVIQNTVQDDGFKAITLEELSEPVQVAVKALNETYKVDELLFNAETGVTKVKVTNKEDLTKKEILFDKEGKEIKPEKAIQAVEKEEVE